MAPAKQKMAKQTHRQAYRQLDKKHDRHTYIQKKTDTDTQTDRKKNKQEDRRRDRDRQT